MGKQITYNVVLMNNIASKYSAGYKKLESAILDFNSFKNSFKDYYDGQANVEIFDVLSSTMLDHLKLLLLCYSNMEKFVNTSLEEMVAADKGLANGVKVTTKNGGGRKDG